MSAMQAFWSGRNSREQLLLIVAGALILLLGLWQFVYVPLADYRAAAEQRHDAAAARLERMVLMASEARSYLAAGEPMSRGGSGGPVRAIATSSAQELGISVTRLQPGEGNSVTLWLEGVPAPRLYEWVALLREEHGVVVDRASLTAEDASPTVRAQLRLTAARSGE